MLPRVIIFNGISLDGRMDFGSGEVDMGLYYGLAARWNAGAMLSGSQTMLTGLPAETMPEVETFEPPAELHPLHVPFLVVVDSRGRIRNWNVIRGQPFWREVVVLCSQSTPRDYLAYLDKRGIAYILTGDDRVDLRRALEELNTRFGVTSVRVDSGGVLNGVLLRARLVDEVSVLIDPCLVGGTSPRSLFVTSDLTQEEEVTRLRLIHMEQVKENVVWLRYVVLH